MSSRTKKNTWTLILKVIITVATAVAGALGLNACIWIVVQFGLAITPRGRSNASSAFTSGTDRKSVV